MSIFLVTDPSITTEYEKARSFIKDMFLVRLCYFVIEFLNRQINLYNENNFLNTQSK